MRPNRKGIAPASGDPTPDWYRGDEHTGLCDYLSRQDTACDAPPVYAVLWLLADCDSGREQVSNACLAHGHLVPREYVRKIQSLDRLQPVEGEK